MSILSNIFSSLVMNSTGTEVKQPKKKESVINLYRYLRFFDSASGNIDSNSGMTFNITLDYTVGTIAYRAVICNEDNFSRKRGRDLVDASNRPLHVITMNYNQMTGKYEIDPDKGTMGMILSYIYRNDINHTHENKMYKRFIHKMHRLGYLMAILPANQL